MNLESFVWVLHAVVALGLIWLVTYIFEKNFFDIAKIVYQEIRALIKRKRSMGAVNMAGVVTAVFFGVITIVAIDIDKVMRFLVQIFGTEQVRVFEKSASYETMFYVVIAFLFFSILAMLLDMWRRQ